MMRTLLAVSTAFFALAACSNPTPTENPQAVATARASDEDPTPPAPPAGPYAATPAPGEELPTSQTTPGPIPLAFRHVWAIDQADCKREPGLTRIAIAPGAIRFYEGRAVVVKSETASDTKLILDVDHASEGTTSRERHSLSLDASLSRLLYQRRNDSFSYIRCD